MNEGIFRLSTEDLAWLALTETVQAFRQLLWAGATARSIAKTVIDVLGSLTVRAHVALQDLTPDILRVYHRSRCEFRQFEASSLPQCSDGHSIESITEPGARLSIVQHDACGEAFSRRLPQLP